MSVSRKILRWFFLFIANGLLFSVLGGLGVYILMSRGGPPTKLWHEVELEEEFTASRSDEVSTLPDYRALEDRLFRELDEKVYDAVPARGGDSLKRYDKGSRSDPGRYPRNWNRSFELSAEEPAGAALLLHGLSDSPYSMRSIGRIFRELGFHVLALRLPGHGTAPSGLLNADRQDWAAALRLGIRHLDGIVGPDRPLILVGYSNGAALAVEHALASLTDPKLRRPGGLVLVSPAIGVSPVAVFARWQAALASIDGLEKLAWTSLLPEFDPYKYNSFAVNAGAQIYDLTGRIERTVRKLGRKKLRSAFPPILSFISVVDATVPPSALVDRLMLPNGSSRDELVLFDVNRTSRSERFFRPDVFSLKNRLLGDPPLPFQLTLLTNEHEESTGVHAVHREASTGRISTEALPFGWPTGIYSLSHVALPFPPDDPVYGLRPPADESRIYLGRIELQGERGVLEIPPAHFTRLRCNPFFGYLERRIREFVARNRD